MSDKFKYTVCSRCMTYNHASFIEETLLGFVMQQTEFPSVFVVVDDASTDNTAEIIREFVYENFDLEDKSVAFRKETDSAHTIFARHNTNKNCFFAVVFLKENHYSQRKSKHVYIAEWMDNSKYNALCEGDDYWIDPYKLKKQVEFMDKHPDYSMCFHAVKDLLPSGETKRNSRYEFDLMDCPIEDFFKHDGAYAPTCSILYREGVLTPEPSFFKKTSVGDSPMILTMFLRGKVCFLNDIMACYRVSAAGSWSQRQKKLSFQQIIKRHKENRAYWYEVDRYTEGTYSRFVRKRKFHTWLSLGKAMYYFAINSFKKLFKL